MKVVIDGAEYDYLSDFNDGWNFSKEDYFKKIKLKNHFCFVKRFESKRPEDISGWQLLEQIKGKNLFNLSRLFDIVLTKEKGRDVYYVFYEFIEGETLYSLLAGGETINLAKLSQNLFSAVASLQKMQFWFPDFTEKNIFFSENEGFQLIDLDSTQAVSKAPNNGMWGDKAYWILVYKFYTELKYKINVADIFGITFNYLQIVFLVFRIRIYQAKVIDEYEDIYDKLPAYLNRISPEFRSIFDKAFKNKQNPSRAEDIAEIESLVNSSILTLTDEDIKNIIEEKKPYPKAVIKEFFVDDNPQDDGGGNYVVESGKKFILHWNVENVTNVELYRNDELYLDDAAKNNIEIVEEVYDGDEAEVTFILTVWNKSLEKTSTRLTLTVIKESIPEPIITSFSITDYLKKNANDNYLVQKGKPFMLSWAVENASSIELYKNNVRARMIRIDTKSIKVNGSASDEIGKQITYKIKIYNEAGTSLESNTIAVKFISLSPVIKYFGADNTTFKSGEAFQLSWSVENTNGLRIMRNDKVFKMPAVTQTSIELTEVNGDNKQTEVTYILQASNNEEKVESNKVVVSIAPEPKVVVPDDEYVEPRSYRKYIIASIALVLVLMGVYFFNTSNEPKVYSFESAGIHELDTINIEGRNLSIKNGTAEVLFKNARGIIIEQTESRIQVVVPSLSIDESYIAIEVCLNGKCHVAANNVLYSPDKTTRYTPVTLPPSLHEIWYDPSSEIYVNIDLLKKTIYYSKYDKSQFARGSIVNTVSEKNTGIYKLTLNAYNGREIHFGIKNIAPESFELCIDSNSNESCEKFLRMSLYYDDPDPLRVYLPDAIDETVNNLTQDQSLKFDKLVRNAGSNDLLIDMFLNNKFIKKPAKIGHLIDKLKSRGFNYTVTQNNDYYYNDSDPFERNYIMISARTEIGAGSKVEESPATNDTTLKK